MTFNAEIRLHIMSPMTCSADGRELQQQPLEVSQPSHNLFKLIVILYMLIQFCFRKTNKSFYPSLLYYRNSYNVLDLFTYNRIFGHWTMSQLLL